MISATHSHTGPVLDRNSAFGGKSELVQRLSRRPAGEDRRGRAPGGGPARARAGLRRLRPRGVDRLQPPIPHEGRHGRLEPRQAQPEHPQARRARSTPRSRSCSSSRPPASRWPTYVNYAVHLDNVGEPKISADLPFTLARALADFKGPEMVTVFSAGCCGDVNHIDVRWARAAARLRERRAHGHDPRRRGAAHLAAPEARRGGRRPRPQRDRPAGAPRRSARPTWRGPARSSRGSRTRRRRGRASSRWSRPSRRGTSPRGRAGRRRSRSRSSPWATSWRGSRCPARSSSSWAWRSSRTRPFPRTIIAELANGSIGYIPSRRAYAQGNYEVISARCAEGSGERLVDAAVRLLKELYAESETARAPRSPATGGR